MNTTTVPIIAPFFADVDTRAGGGLLPYGSGSFDGHTAFGVTWDGVGVGYYNLNTNKLNKFQVLLVSRSDINASDFDIVFKYDQIQWETGDFSGGSNGLGGASARAGYANGTQNPGTTYELPGSAVPGSYLDTGPAGTSLIHNRLNSDVDGRYIFRVRNGEVQAAVPEPMSLVVWAVSAVSLRGFAWKRATKAWL